MSFREELNIDISSSLDASGFRRLEANLAKTRAQMETTFQTLNEVDEFNRLRASANRFDNAMQEANLTLGKQGNFFKQGRQGALSQVDAIDQLAAAMRRLRNGTPINISFGEMRSPAELLKDDFDPERFEIPSPSASDNLSPAAQNFDVLNDTINEFSTSNLVAGTSLDRLSEATASTNNRVTESITATEQARRNMMDMGFAVTETAVAQEDRTLATKASAVASRRLSSVLAPLSDRLAQVRVGARGAARNIAFLTGALASAAPAARTLQLRLLNLQFSLLTVAFIFGGLAAGALGAVGVFEVLGNTLRFFFLPAALNVLDIVLDLQNFILGLDRETRESIGTFFLIIAAIAAVGSAIAALLMPLTSLIGFLSSLVTPIVAAAKALMSLGIFGAVAAVIGAFVAGLIGGFQLVMSVARKFNRVIAAVVAGILVVIAGVLATISAPFLAVAAAIGAAVGGIIAVLVLFRDEILAILGAVVSGVAKFIASFVSTLGKLFGMLISFLATILGGIVKFVGGLLAKIGKVFGSIGQIVSNFFMKTLPQLINKGLNALMKLPGKLLDLGVSLMNSLAEGIMNAGSVVFDAVLSILPDFMADAIRGTASAIGNAASGVTDAVGNFAQGAANTFSGMFGGGGETNNNTTVNNQQNQVDATVEVNNSEETAGETGRSFGQGFNNEVNRGMFGDRRP